MEQKGLLNWTIFEGSKVAGGLARSIIDENGFTWDLGGHVTFARDPSYYKMLDSLNIEFNYKTRVSKVWVKDKWIDYPF